MLLVSASLLNCADLLAIFDTYFFLMESMDFFNFCLYPGRTKQILSLGFGLWDSEETLIHIVKKQIFFAGIFNMKSWGGEKTRIQPSGEVIPDWGLVSAVFLKLVALLGIVLSVGLWVEAGRAEVASSSWERAKAISPSRSILLSVS